MNLRSILLATLAAAPLHGCLGTNCGAASTAGFSVDEGLDGAQLDAFLASAWSDSGDAGDPGAIACEDVCAWAQSEVVQGDPIVSIDSCTFEVDEGGGDEGGHVTCAGTAGYLCEGRRPHGHCEPDAPQVGDLGAALAALAHLEAASVPAFEELADWLAARGHRGLADRARAAADDERRHARWVTALAAAAGASVAPPARSAGHPLAPAEVALHNAVEGCVAETFAALVAWHRAAHAATPALRSTFARIAEDETRHAQLAWDVHAALLPALAPADVEWVEAARRAALAALPARAAAQAARLPVALGGPSVGQAPALAANLAARLRAA